MSDKSLKYGQRTGDGKGREFSVAASQYLYRFGGAFMYLDTAGNLTMCTSSDTGVVMGYAEMPKQAAGYDAWKSSSTAGADKLFVITSLDDVYEIPWDQTTASIAASNIGDGCVATITSATYTLTQKAQYKATTASCLFTVVDVDTTNKTAFVKIRPSKKQ